ncbi:MAG: YkvA family protein [Candidatus Cloacimonadota bacterium]|nr:YkvA family protein [Candidatus Cloacimonadota bacterium]
MKEKKDIKENLNIDKNESKKIYDLLRKRVRKSATNYVGKRYIKFIEYVLLIPDFFMLLWRLMLDKEIGKEKKLFIGAITAYVLLPIDLIPDFIPVIGFVDDLVLIAIGLNTIFVKTDKKILQKHWSGEGDILERIQSIIKLGNDILSNRIIGKITRWVNKRAGIK